MKTLTQFKPALASIMLGATFMLAPIAASAHSTTTPLTNVSAGAVITTDGFVRVAGATITAVSGNVVNATTAFGSNILNWIINIGADTKVAANGSVTASTTALKVGDKIDFLGNLTSTSTSALIVNAKTVFDASSMQTLAHLKGTIANISTSTGAFTLTKKDGTNVTVNTDASTLYKINGAVGSFGSLVVGNIVEAIGHLSTNGLVLGATNVTVHSNATTTHTTDNDDNKGKHKGEGKDTDVHTNNGLHLGQFLKLNGFFSLGRNDSAD